jgi:uncharacterized protein
MTAAAEVIPPAPPNYFNDYAGVVPPGTAAGLNQELENFERATSSQILVAVYPRMQSESSIEDYTVRVAEAWKVGQKGKNNGAVLFVFIADRKMFIQVGYGLEGALPDALAKQIIESDIKPHFKAGDYAAGLTAGVNAMLAAVRGEYKGTGRTAAEGTGNDKVAVLIMFGVFGLIIALILARVLTGARGRVYGRRGYYSSWGGWSSGGGWSGGGGGGGFSGGGGSFGGGGAGGSW